MSELWTPPKPALYVPESALDTLEQDLGFEGPGVSKLPGVVSESFLADLLAEAANPDLVQWRDAGGTYVNVNGLTIVQNHEVFALKVQGDYEPIWQVPLMAQLGIEAEAFVQSLQPRYESLGTWQADEMSYHNYYDPSVGLSFHRDNLRFPGLIVVIAIEGEADFQVAERTPIRWETDPSSGKKVVAEWEWHNIYTIPTQPGDMVLTRAPGLLPGMNPSHRPEHAVMNAKVPRKSFMLRANLRPRDRGYGFEYANW